MSTMMIPQTTSRKSPPTIIGDNIVLRVTQVMMSDIAPPCYRVGRLTGCVGGFAGDRGGLVGIRFV